VVLTRRLQSAVGSAAVWTRADPSISSPPWQACTSFGPGAERGVFFVNVAGVRFFVFTCPCLTSSSSEFLGARHLRATQYFPPQAGGQISLLAHYDRGLQTQSRLFRADMASWARHRDELRALPREFLLRDVFCQTRSPPPSSIQKLSHCPSSNVSIMTCVCAKLREGRRRTISPSLAGRLCP